VSTRTITYLISRSVVYPPQHSRNSILVRCKVSLGNPISSPNRTKFDFGLVKQREAHSVQRLRLVVGSLSRRGGGVPAPANHGRKDFAPCRSHWSGLGAAGWPKLHHTNAAKRHACSRTLVLRYRFPPSASVTQPLECVQCSLVHSPA
jgi:hypothetical protein